MRVLDACTILEANENKSDTICPCAFDWTCDDGDFVWVFDNSWDTRKLILTRLMRL